MKDAQSALDPFRRDLFQNRTVLITGGGTGIGKQLAIAFGTLGANVVVASRKVENCQHVVAEIASAGGRGLALEANVRDSESVERMAAAAHEHFGSIDVLFANAGANFLAPAVGISPNGFRSVVETVLFGTFYCAQACAKYMFEQKRGRIISMTATNGMNGSPLMAHSGASKAGVINLMQTLAVEWAPQGVTCNSVSPGAVNTEGANSRLWADPALMQMVAASVPLGRMSVPADLLGLCVFLASDAAQFITGSNFVVDGGEMLRKLPAAFGSPS